MKAFRVRDIGNVETGIGWKGMDGQAFVLVGGGNRPYVTVAPALATASEGEGRVFEVDFKVVDGQGLELIAPTQANDPDGSRRGSALVVIPTGGYEFHYDLKQLAVNPRCGNACRVVVLAPGEEVRAFPKVRTFAEAQSAKMLVLRFDGREVTFQVA